MTQPIARNRITPISAKGPASGPKPPAKGKTPATPPKEDNRQLYIIAGVGVVLVMLLGWWWWTRPSAQMGIVRDMQRELFAVPVDKMSADERKAKFEALRAEREKLSASEQKALRQEFGQEMQHKRNNEAVAYLKMTPAERTKVIDQKLAREQAAQKSRPAAGGNGPMPAGVMASGNPGGGPGGGPGGPQKTMNPEDRDNKRRSMLLNVSAEARAGMDQMRVDMAARRAQLGLPPSTGGRGPKK